MFSFFLNISIRNAFPFIFNNTLYNNYWFFTNNFTKLKKQPNFLFFKYSDLLKSIFLLLSWLKVRVLYYINNWVYTTNHKRIAINYFWFVILAGIVGMVLATVIRLELAYPGVGIFAGDSLQYLTLVSAHGVIMVFFMIMPLLFGAFANFLLPTQLGVHDVAFPRLNSAAFWFLPASLIMLAQLVCIDRRYQRMNCFNIREIQAILKRRFFTDLINTNDHHDFLNETMVGLRFKTNNLNSIAPNMFLFHNYGLELTSKNRNTTYVSTIFAEKTPSFLNIFNFKLTALIDKNIFFNFFNSLYLCLFPNFTIYAFTSYVTVPVLFINFYSVLLSALQEVLAFTLDSGSILLKHEFWFSVPFVTQVLRDALTPILISFFINSLDFLIYCYLYWLPNKTSNIFINTFNMLNEIVFYKFQIKLNFNWHIFLTNSYEFFFVINCLEFMYLINKSFLNTFASVNIIDFFSPQYLYYNIDYALNFTYTLNFVNYYDSLLYSKNNLFSLSIKNENFLDKTYFKISDINFFSSPLPLIEKMNFNSYFVYFYIIFISLLKFPFYLFTLLYNILNFKETAILIDHFNDVFSTWLLPLIISDNIFFTLWKKFHQFMLIENNYESVSFFKYIFNFVLIYIILIYQWFFINFNKNIFLFSYDVFINNFLTPLFYCLTMLSDIFFFLSLLLFNLKTNFIFEWFYFIKFDAFIKKFILTDTLMHHEYSSLYFLNIHSKEQFKFGNEESQSVSTRYHKFDNPIFKYDYKSGDYFPKLYKEIYTYLFSSSLDITSGLRSAPWFFSTYYLELFDSNFNTFYANITKTFDNKINLHSWDSTRFLVTDAFYNFFYTLSNENLFMNQRWVALNSLNQKFYRMLNTSSMQQRIYSNWRQLKFTREAWRCKLLTARHQKTLYKRYVNEDGVFWSIERNAKDLIPGWAVITPFSARTRFTAVGKTDIALMGVLLVLNSSIISAANFLVTYRYLSTLNNRKMRDARSFFTEGIMVASWMMIFANPMLVIGIIMLLSDRHWQTSFFDYSGGGDTVLFQHMFWFFGHPEVYIIIIPTFGFTNTILSYYLRKRISARASLMYSMYTIAFLGFFVWGHHMYMVGLAHTTRMLFSTLTVMISVPAATKLMHWCVTLVNSSLSLELPMICILTFVFFFVSGGISGMNVANTGMDVLFHDTFYVVGHFHVMLAGAAMIGSFGAFYFYFVAIFGVKYSRIYAYLHYVYYLLGQLLTVIPMLWLGYAGMPRRVLDYPAAFGGWHSVISGGHMLSVAGIIAFFIMIFDSLRQAKAVTRNTFGVGRYNTRLNFYIYEIARLIYVQQKSWTLFKFNNPTSLKLNGLNYQNFEYLETTLFSYTFYKQE